MHLNMTEIDPYPEPIQRDSSWIANLRFLPNVCVAPLYRLCEAGKTIGALLGDLTLTRGRSPSQQTEELPNRNGKVPTKLHRATKACRPSTRP